MGREGFEPMTFAMSSLKKKKCGLGAIQKWLSKRCSPTTVRDRLSYAKKFSHCLLERDFNELQMLSDDKRIHVMKTLSTLSKFLGIYDVFRILVQNYGLKWSSNNRDDLIIARLTKVVNGDEIIEWIKTVKIIAPEYASFIDFMVVTGLRYCEAVTFWNLIIQLAEEKNLERYYNKDVLEHFRFKEIFLSKTKKAFISFVSQDLIRDIEDSKSLTPNIIPCRLKRKKIKLRFSDIREYNATMLTKYLSPPEIDFIQGRVSTSVFLRNYFNPAWIRDLKKRTLTGSNKLMNKIQMTK